MFINWYAVLFKISKKKLKINKWVDKETQLWREKTHLDCGVFAMFNSQFSGQIQQPSIVNNSCLMYVLNELEIDLPYLIILS